MSDVKVNLACGRTYVRDGGWVNLDYSPANADIVQADLLGSLPFSSGSAALVYCSHFLEHIPRTRVAGFLSECWRILSPGGVIRLVLPDLEEMCQEYLAQRKAGDHEKADFVVVEMIDQAVRLRSGGELGALYHRYAADPSHHGEMIDYVRARNGEQLRPGVGPDHDVGNGPRGPTQADPRTRLLSRLVQLPERVRRRAGNAWFRWLLRQLPPAFREQNISLASVGERHHWLWDLHQLSQALRAAGFETVERCGCATSRIPNFPFYPLDIDDDGRPRKGAESMYVEASKPC